MDRQRSLLVVDDDERLCRLLQRMLQGNGYRVATVTSGSGMFEHLSSHDIDLVILDRMLPEGDGLDLAQRLRTHSDIPIIMLTGRDQPLEKVHGLEVGADDYVTKPFDERELLARVQTVLRRSSSQPRTPPNPDVIFAGWTLEPQQRSLRSPTGQTSPLSEHEFSLLSLFLAHPNETLTRETIMLTVMHREWSSYDRSVDVLVSKLRRKLRTDNSQPDLIQSVRGSGYRFCASVATQ